MQNYKTATQLNKPRKTTPIKTTFMELLGELTRLTDNDALVMATMKKIFTSYRVRMTGSLVPVRLVHEDLPAKATRLNVGRRSSAWA